MRDDTKGKTTTEDIKESRMNEEHGNNELKRREDKVNTAARKDPRSLEKTR